MAPGQSDDLAPSLNRAALIAETRMNGDMNVIPDQSHSKRSHGSWHETDPMIGKRHKRRLSDKILVAFHQACDVDDLDVAEHLLCTLEMMTMRRPVPGDGNRRRNVESLVAAHERLWHLRHPES